MKRSWTLLNVRKGLFFVCGCSSSVIRYSALRVLVSGVLYAVGHVSVRCLISVAGLLKICRILFVIPKK